MRLPKPPLVWPVLFASLSIGAGGCFVTRSSAGGAETEFTGVRRPDPAAVAVPEGYVIEVVATGLTFPTGVAFDDENRPHVVEAGYSYGEVFVTPRLVRVEPDGQLTEVAHGSTGTDGNGPWTGAAHLDGAFYIAEGGAMRGGRILRVSPDGGATEIIVENLPSRGDHHTNGPAVGPDGMLYFGVGTATNSGIVGPDNHAFGWLERFPDFHDIPAKDITLAGRNITGDNVLTPQPGDAATTGAFVPFGMQVTPGVVIRGQMPANGTVMRVRPTPGAEPELVAWGLRNPFGLAFTPGGELYVTENSFDVRGSRPVYGTGDLLWRIDLDNLGTWYGWPDFHGGMPLTDEDHFKAPGHPAPGMLLAEHPNPVPKPAAKLGVHASANGLDIARSEAFGHVGQAFIVSFGDMTPNVGKVLAPVGYNVVRVDLETGVIHAFAVNRGRKNGPASLLGHGGLERPIAARFDNTGEALYLVDFGVMTIEKGKILPRQGTGVLWRITRAGAVAATPLAATQSTNAEVRP